MLIGILAGLATCALWGLTFVAPRAVAPLTTLDLTAARYGIFGLVSVLLMIDRRFRPAGLSRRQIAIGLLLGGAAYIGYFISAAYAVQLAGAALPPLITGTMPVVLAVIANVQDRSVAWRSLALPLLLISSGVGVVNLSLLGPGAVTDHGTIFAGLACSFAALGIWVAYGLVNARVMRAGDAPDALHWTGLQGIGAALGSIAILPFTSFWDVGAVSSDDGMRFLAWALVMGIAGSWLATWCWVVAAGRLPLALSAQLIVAETVFGLIYGFIFEQRWPHPVEWAGCGLQIVGVCITIRLFTRPAVTRPVVVPV